MTVSVEKQEHIWTVIIERPDKKNAVNRDTADGLFEAFKEFDADESARVAVLWGRGGTFCAGADLGAVAELSEEKGNRLDPDMSQPGPMGPSRMELSKPLIAAVSGYAVAGGLELSCWCDIRVAEETAVFGVYCRRFGVPLIDGGTQRLPRIVGLGRALDLILTGRSVEAKEALEIGLANYLVPEGQARQEAERLAAKISAFPQLCLRSDRQAVFQGLDQTLARGMEQEFELGLKVVQSGETRQGARQFVNRDR
ncbi:MAG: crotonase/enoyl-CoA hydratase family protein [Desulfobacteraceae bacterium]|nr:crotonase/enoyl-CoA hydratase family protein [Desulfobacteraceae bacterium]